MALTCRLFRDVCSGLRIWREKIRQYMPHLMSHPSMADGNSDWAKLYRQLRPKKRLVHRYLGKQPFSLVEEYSSLAGELEGPSVLEMVLDSSWTRRRAFHQEKYNSLPHRAPPTRDEDASKIFEKRYFVRGKLHGSRERYDLSDPAYGPILTHRSTYEHGELHGECLTARWHWRTYRLADSRIVRLRVFGIWRAFFDQGRRCDVWRSYELVEDGNITWKQVCANVSLLDSMPSAAVFDFTPQG